MSNLDTVEVKRRSEFTRVTATELCGTKLDEVRDFKQKVVSTSRECRVATHTAPIRVGTFSSDDLWGLESGGERQVEIKDE